MDGGHGITTTPMYLMPWQPTTGKDVTNTEFFLVEQGDVLPMRRLDPGNLYQRDEEPSK